MSKMHGKKWGDRYLNLAKEVSTWSRDPSTKVGAVVVGDHGQLLSQGYNGFPRGVGDSAARYKNRDVKYKLVVHAEMNAIYNAGLNGISLDGATLYVYGCPICNECAKGIIQVGIKKVVSLRPKDLKSLDRWTQSIKDAKAMFTEAEVMYLTDVEKS
jgi:dCMP deaminase|tara:strand:- start:3412 stop:3882 length:471 start_codon:yes stop_codon:yes gene_type:complete